jgi:pimeloyl-ACP methyl ester carboxylesterase
MTDISHKPRHRTVDVDGLDIFFREAGRPDSPAVLLLHGFPSSSHTFRQILAPLARTAHIIAPDLPGFGFSSAPGIDEYEYRFERLADTMEGFLDRIGIDEFFVYLHDFGAPVGYHLATRKPDRIHGLIVQNGNAHQAGLGPQWDTAKAYWADPNEQTRAKLPEWLDFEGTRYQYLGGLDDRLRTLHPPESWHLDWQRLNRPGNLDAQFELFGDYATHVDRFETIADYHREHQPPALVLWGRRDPFFDVDEVLCYLRALERVEAHIFDAGHLMLETHSPEAAELIASFVANR